MQIKNISAIALLLLTGVLVHVKGQRVDKTHDGLKGAVKTVSLEIVRFDLVDGKKYVEKPRVPAEIRTYDEAGNQTRFEYYDDDGILQNTLVYDFIGKQRVAKSIDAPTRNAFVRVIPLPKGTRIDPRYTYKYVHQYDAQDRRIQTLVYLSSGELWQRHTFKFRKNRMTHVLYSRGRLNSKTEHNLDEQGNETSFIQYAEYIVADKTVYKYDEFDAQGNWTTRRVYRGIKEVEDSQLTRAHPWSVKYRVTTYY
jgi:hypothetical protein